MHALRLKNLAPNRQFVIKKFYIRIIHNGVNKNRTSLQLARYNFCYQLSYRGRSCVLPKILIMIISADMSIKIPSRGPRIRCVVVCRDCDACLVVDVVNIVKRRSLWSSSCCFRQSIGPSPKDRAHISMNRAIFQS